MSRGNPEVEAVLNRRIDYMSGPEWLAREVLRHRWVMAVAGTHGKTTTTAMLLWILDQAGFDAGYLVGGVPQDFPVSARLGSSDNTNRLTHVDLMARCTPMRAFLGPGSLRRP